MFCVSSSNDIIDAGTLKANVLPDPVSATPITSLPDNKMAMKLIELGLVYQI